MPRYRLYIDEVGNPDLRNSENLHHRFLSLTGVIIDLAYVQRRMHPDLEALKVRYFDSHPDEPVIMHRKEIVNRRPPFQALRDRAVEAAFNENLLNLLREWEYRIVTVCIDKKNHVAAYGNWRYDPYHYCMAVLLERFSSWLKRRGARGNAMAESRGGKEDRQLKESFRRLWDRGTDYVGPEQFQGTLTSRELKFKQKTDNIAGLQLADLLAHPSRCEILDERGLLGRPLAPFAVQIIEILQEKYDQSGEVIYGKKFL